MEGKYKGKYRIPSNRLRGWNYAENGHYFITIVTCGRNHYFGKIEAGEMVLNDIGKIVYEEFFKSFEIREELFLGEFILMPNHLHAIVILDKSKCNIADMGENGGLSDNIELHANNVGLSANNVELHANNVGLSANNVELHANNVETHGRASLRISQQIQRQPKSISSFVACFKSSTIKQIDDWIDLNNLPMKKFNKENPLWQANYHDHIIRNAKEYKNISDYIINNPMKWEEDIFKNG